MSLFGYVGTLARQLARVLIQTRTKTKTNKSAAKRLIKTADGYVRKQSGRNHGNGNFSASSLKHLNGFVPVTAKGGHLKKMKFILSG